MLLLGVGEVGPCVCGKYLQKDAHTTDESLPLRAGTSCQGWETALHFDSHLYDLSKKKVYRCKIVTDAGDPGEESTAAGSSKEGPGPDSVGGRGVVPGLPEVPGKRGEGEWFLPAGTEPR